MVQTPTVTNPASRRMGFIARRREARSRDARAFDTRGDGLAQASSSVRWRLSEWSFNPNMSLT